MPENKNLVQCYNRGCGQLFDPSDNSKDDCLHHPGSPIFHDAYKGWSCCNKKSVDFTEFLNIKGCTRSNHSNERPPEPEKKALDKELENKEVIVVRAPVVGPQLPRPPFETPMVTLKPTVADSLKQAVQNSSHQTAAIDESKIAIGTTCKNGGCSATYEGHHSNDDICTYHPGSPVFHEGLKFWSCCQKKTTDFNTFLSQPGCTTGTHKWFKEATPAGTVKCRWDWHQTSEFIIVSVYAKKYDPTQSFVKLNPIRLNTKLVFREQGDAAFELDLELRGVVNIERSSVSMLSTKIEVKLKKAEPGAWSKLDFPRTEPKKEVAKQQEIPTPSEDDYEDLSTVEAIGKVNVTG
ncbi:unnamed protein product [Arctia plantaginis]|uniref:Cysteine and histidine-rich domain-containing protein n=1 Tax=Arctia plantaginis TaxID=874455 RepID=A0A8S0YUQ1_ARCPL|nr:unnamed protein product [Arctia plantaginis]CAB3247875.1 unnamed protein product [Arctia plantaginis]